MSMLNFAINEYPLMIEGQAVDTLEDLVRQTVTKYQSRGFAIKYLHALEEKYNNATEENMAEINAHLSMQDGTYTSTCVDSKWLCINRHWWQENKDRVHLGIAHRNAIRAALLMKMLRALLRLPKARLAKHFHCHPNALEMGDDGSMVYMKSDGYLHTVSKRQLVNAYDALIDNRNDI